MILRFNDLRRMCCIDTYICTYQLLQSDLLITQMEVTYINPWKGHLKNTPKRSRREEPGIIYEITYIYIFTWNTFSGVPNESIAAGLPLFFQPRLAASRLPFCFWPLRQFRVNWKHEVPTSSHKKTQLFTFKTRVYIYIYIDLTFR